MKYWTVKDDMVIFLKWLWFLLEESRVSALMIYYGYLFNWKPFYIHILTFSSNLEVLFSYFCLTSNFFFMKRKTQIDVQYFNREVNYTLRKISCLCTHVHIAHKTFRCEKELTYIVNLCLNWYHNRCSGGHRAFTSSKMKHEKSFKFWSDCTNITAW